MLFNRQRPGKSKAPDMVNYNELAIREYKMQDKINVFRVLNEYRREFYVNIYKLCFKSWFTYAVTGLLMGLTYNLVNNSTATLFGPPLIITVYLLYKVNRYRTHHSRLFSIYDIENLTLVSSSVKRKQNQGVYVCMYHDKLIAYCIYIRQPDELETVCIKEVCVSADFRGRKIATYFLEYLCKNVFKQYLYKRVTFTVSDMLHTEASGCCRKKADYIKKLYSWKLYNFVPGISDIRSVYAIDFDDICKID